ncbi:hypothetical protein GCM10028817_10650 [Spirosoma pomorum]
MATIMPYLSLPIELRISGKVITEAKMLTPLVNRLLTIVDKNFLSLLLTRLPIFILNNFTIREYKARKLYYLNFRKEKHKYYSSSKEYTL